MPGLTSGSCSEVGLNLSGPAGQAGGDESESARILTTLVGAWRVDPLSCPRVIASPCGGE